MSEDLSLPIPDENPKPIPLVSVVEERAIFALGGEIIKIHALVNMLEARLATTMMPPRMEAEAEQTLAASRHGVSVVDSQTITLTEIQTKLATILDRLPF